MNNQPKFKKGDRVRYELDEANIPDTCDWWAKVDTWDTICDDLNSDRLHDLALHLDFIAPVVNIAEITDILKQHAHDK